MNMPEIDSIDREQAFLLYASFCGDLARTAHALNVSPVTVLRMADDEGWNDKLAPILALKKSSKPGDVERAMNRAYNFVQGHRMRMIVNRVIQRLTGFNEKEFEDYLLTGTSPHGVKFAKLSTRALADLASAMEKAHAMTYASLNDTAPERSRRNEAGDDSVSAGLLHVKLAAAMSEAGESKTPRALLFDAQLEQAAAAVKVIQDSAKPANPNDNDDH